MIERYTLSPMDKLTSDHYRFQVWHEVEMAAAKAQGAPDSMLEEMVSRPGPSINELRRREQETGHDVMAFLQAWNDRLSSQHQPWLHRNMTSSDLVDTANSLIIKRIGDVLTRELFLLFETSVGHAQLHKDTIRVGRTHGQHAEVTTWGHWVAGFAHGLHRALKRLEFAVEAAQVAKLSGPVGDYKNVTPHVERTFARELGLSYARAATQVVPRDLYADVVWACSQVATIIESFALEVRLGQQTELDELREPRSGSSPTGSSAMPHKRNPVICEQLCGLARLVRAQVLPVQEGAALWHERDISHSSVERVALRQALVLTHYMISKARHVLGGLEVNEDRMIDNAVHLNNGEIFSSAIRSWLVDNGLTDPQLAWRLVQDATERGRERNKHLVEATIITVSAWEQIAERVGVRDKYPDFDPDWAKFREAIDLDNQVSKNDDYTFRQLELLRRVVSENRYNKTGN